MSHKSAPAELLAAAAGVIERWCDGWYLFGAQAVAVWGRPNRNEGLSVPIASPEDLIVMKVLAGRRKDIEDVRSVLRALLTKLDVAYIRSMLGTIEQALDQSDLLPLLEDEIALAERLRP